MYELVNTSAPNGLIPGTHGFATVAMTKGMPDAIRTRVENFCAYPHRTSSHDQSYWTENPVNWFHLTLPGGDHVVGRTAPSDFDYTGRTNRISRVLYFKAKEMPQIGGVRVLAAEAERLSGNWEGEPRYLAEDKATAGRLMMAAPPANVMPSNWVKMFGSQGESLARRFAVLLANKVRGANRGIYFKASATDTDGTRLLGLFSDLIDLLPVELRPLVTFSTFAPCVPSGTVCHLRGIYDSDAAFATASALQPWVDCGSCEVKHAELLPQEAAVRKTFEPVRPEVSPAGRMSAHGRGGPIAQRGRFCMAPSVPQHKPDTFVKWMIALTVVILLVGGCIVCMIMWQRHGANPVNPQNVPSLDEIKEISHKDAEKEKAEAERLKEKEERRRQQEEAERKKEAEEIAKKERELEEEKAVAKTNKNQSVSEKTATPRKKTDKGKENACLSLKDLQNMEIVPFDKNWIDKLKDGEKAKLCETNSLDVFYLSDGQCKKATSRLDKKTTRDIRSRNETASYSMDFHVPASTLWTVVYVPSLKKTYWQWNKKVEEQLFAESDTVNLLGVLFDGNNEAYELYKKHLNVMIFAVTWRDGRGPWSLLTKNEQFSIDVFGPKDVDLCQLREDI